VPLRIDLRRPFTRIMGVGVFNFRLLLLAAAPFDNV
jgi:hypothetical protein